MATRLTIDPKDTDLERFRIDCHQSCITKPWNNIPDGLPPPPRRRPSTRSSVGTSKPMLVQQVDEQKMQDTILAKQLNHMIKKDGITKNRVKTLHESTIKMILFASAMGNESVPIDLAESCRRFVNSKTVALTEQELKIQFEYRGMTEVSFPTEFTANMYLGALLWSSGDTPSNHTPFSFTKAKPLRMEEHKNRHLMLQLILTQGKGITVNKIKASNKQEVHAPMNVHDMAEQLKMFTIVKDIFFREFSAGSQCLRSLQTMINRNKSSSKARERLDKEFPSKFLFEVNSHYQILLKQCRIATNRSDTIVSIIDFSQLFSQVVFGSFHIVLPPTFTMKSPEAIAATRGKEDSSHIEGDNDRKREKKKTEETRDLIKNNAPRPELCMLPNKMWPINFANKNIDKRPS